MIIYGKNPVREALRAGKTINKLYAQNGVKDSVAQSILDLAREQKIKVIFMNKQALRNIAGNDNHQGFVIETVDFTYSQPMDVLKYAEDKGELPFVLILDEIEDPHNLGAIIRTAEAIGVHGIILQKDRACAVTDVVFKTSAGAINNMLICRETNLTQVIEFLKKQGLWVFGLELGGKDIYKTNLKGPIALVVGSEGRGIKELVKKNCDEVIALPMKGEVNSLNASVATGVALYEIARQRNLNV